MPELTLILKQVSKRLGVGCHQRRRTYDRQLHRTTILSDQTTVLRGLKELYLN